MSTPAPRQPSEREISEARTRQLAAQDIQDIKTLRGAESFNRYFIRRLRDRQTAINTRFRNDPPAKCDDREREILRRLLLEYDELLKLLDNDERAAGSTLGSMGPAPSP